MGPEALDHTILKETLNMRKNIRSTQYQTQTDNEADVSSIASVSGKSEGYG